MYEERPAVDEVVVVGLEDVTHDVVPAHFDAGQLGSCEEPRVDVRRHDVPPGAHPPGEPARHRAVARTDLEAAPPPVDAKPLQATRRHGVHELAEELQALALE